MILHLKKSGKILPLTPVFMDSPMASKATDIYRKYPEIFNAHTKEEIKSTDPFTFPGLTIVDKRDESRGIYLRKGAKVIIAGSGMMTGGRILGHAAHYLPMPSTRLLIVGYQGEGTIGRALLEGAGEIVIDGIPVPVNATVNSTQAMSSHADQSQLLKWLKHIKNVKKVVLTHGEDGPRTSLASRINEELHIGDVAMPHLNQEVKF
jgi:metallo-beta-lactamase family protein